MRALITYLVIEQTAFMKKQRAIPLTLFWSNCMAFYKPSGLYEFQKFCPDPLHGEEPTIVPQILTLRSLTPRTVLAFQLQV